MVEEFSRFEQKGPPKPSIGRTGRDGISKPVVSVLFTTCVLISLSTCLSAQVTAICLLSVYSSVYPSVSLCLSIFLDW